MRRRAFLASAAAASAAFSQSHRPNVLFVVADDLNSSIGCFGNPWVKTPNLDRFAQRAVCFRRAYCQFPLCNPSRSSFLSGRRPESTRIHTLPMPTRTHMADAVMLPEMFRKNGYFTAQAGKIFHTGDEHEDPRSWDVQIREFGKSPPNEAIEHREVGHEEGHTFEWSTLRWNDDATPDGIMARRAAALMERSRTDGKPFFLGVGFRRPHAPYAAPRRYFDLYDPSTLPLPPASDPGRVLPAALAADPDPPITPKQHREFLAAYYACTSFVDAQFGVLMNTLDRLGLWDNTIVVFLGDHGYHLGDHGGIWHKTTLFEESARAPLMVYAPGRRAAGQSSERLVEFVDLYPTIADLCGLPQPDGLEGISMRPLLDDPQRKWKRAAFTMVARNDRRHMIPKEAQWFGKSLRTERWRYTEWDEGRRGAELYDHANDPHELRNLASAKEHAPLITELRGLLRAGWRAALPS